MTPQHQRRRLLGAISAASIAIAILPIAAALPQPIPQAGSEASMSSTPTQSPVASAAGSTDSPSSMSAASAASYPTASAATTPSVTTMTRTAYGVDWVSGSRVSYTSVYTTTSTRQERPTYSFPYSDSGSGGSQLSLLEIVLIVLGVCAMVLGCTFCLRRRHARAQYRAASRLTARQCAGHEYARTAPTRIISTGPIRTGEMNMTGADQTPHGMTTTRVVADEDVDPELPTYSRHPEAGECKVETQSLPSDSSEAGDIGLRSDAGNGRRTELDGGRDEGLPPEYGSPTSPGAHYPPGYTGPTTSGTGR